MYFLSIVFKFLLLILVSCLGDKKQGILSNIDYDVKFLDNTESFFGENVKALTEAVMAHTIIGAEFAGDVSSITSEKMLILHLKKVFFENSKKIEAVQAASLSEHGWQPMSVGKDNFLCYIPPVPLTALEDLEEEMLEEPPKLFENLQEHMRVPLNRVRVLDRRLNGRCFYRNAGWWTYELCWGVGSTQMHIENGEVGTKILLGRAEPQLSNTKVYYEISTSRGPYFSTKYTDGAVCDLTGRRRSIDVRIYCTRSSENVASSILDSLAAYPAMKETLEKSGVTQATVEILEEEPCKYVAWIENDELCSHNKLRQMPRRTEIIKCKKIE